MCLVRVLEVQLKLAKDFGPNQPCLFLELEHQNEFTTSEIGLNMTLLNNHTQIQFCCLVIYENWILFVPINPPLTMMPQTLQGCCSQIISHVGWLAIGLASWLALWMHLPMQTLRLLQQQLHYSLHFSARQIESTYLESPTSTFHVGADKD